VKFRKLIAAAAVSAGLAGSAAPALAAEPAKKPAFGFSTLKAATPEAAKARTEAWLKAAGKFDQTAFDDVWVNERRTVLDRTADALALGNPEVQKFLADVRKADAPAPEAVPSILKDEKQDPFFRTNVSLAFAKAAAGKKVYEEALDALKIANPEVAVDPASFYFFKAVAHHATAMKTGDKDQAVGAIVKLLDDVADAPDRYKMVATLMFFEMQNWAPDPKDLSNIERLMDNSGRRLDLARGGEKTQDIQKKIVFRLDEVIKELEAKAKQGQCQGGNCPGGGEKPGSKPGSTINPSSPAQESTIMGGGGQGKVDEKELRKIAESWGTLPARSGPRSCRTSPASLPGQVRADDQELLRARSNRCTATRSEWLPRGNLSIMGGGNPTGPPPSSVAVQRPPARLVLTPPDSRRRPPANDHPHPRARRRTPRARRPDRAGRADDVTTTAGKKLSGKLVAVDAESVTFAIGDGKVPIPARDVVVVDLGNAAPPKEGGTFSEVELTDGSTFRVARFALKGKSVEADPLPGPAGVAPPKLDIPMGAVFSAMKKADDVKVRDNWKRMLGTRGKRDLYVIAQEGGFTFIQGTVLGGGADEKGRPLVSFEKESGGKDELLLSRAAGLVFYQPQPATPPPTLCKVTDVFGNALTATGIAITPDGVAVTTVAGVKVTYASSAALVRLDYALGNVAYLSDLDPQLDVPEVPAEEKRLTQPAAYLKDRSFANEPINWTGSSSRRGVTLAPDTVATFQPERRLRAVQGHRRLDENGANATSARPGHDRGDGQVLFSETLKRKDKPKGLVLSVKGSNSCGSWSRPTPR
jgi:hypothetical protein